MQKILNFIKKNKQFSFFFLLVILLIFVAVFLFLSLTSTLTVYSPGEREEVSQEVDVLFAVYAVIMCFLPLASS